MDKIKSIGVYLNEKKSIIIGVIIVIALVVAGWAMFSRVSSDGGTIDDLRNQLNTARADQQAAEDKLADIQSGLANSQSTVNSLEQSNSDAQATVGRIQDANTNIENAVNDATATNQSSADLITSSESGVRSSQSIIDEIRKTAKPDENSN